MGKNCKENHSTANESVLSQIYLEEGSLFGSQRGGNGLDKHILGSHGTGLGRSWLLIGQQFVANFWQVFFGEDEADILNDVRQDLRCDESERWN